MVLTNVISDWITKKALDVSTDVLAKYLVIPNFKLFIREELTQINNVLNIIIDAPYRQAVMHLNEGELEKCKDKLIEAISFNELNLPAMLLYADILRFNQKYDLALDYYWEIMEKFGFRIDLIPLPLLEAYEKKFYSSRVSLYRRTIAGSDDNYPEDIYCSPAGFVVRWRGEFRLLDCKVNEWFIVKGYYWGNEREIFYVPEDNPSIAAVTKLSSIKCDRRIRCPS